MGPSSQVRTCWHSLFLQGARIVYPNDPLGRRDFIKQGIAAATAAWMGSAHAGRPAYAKRSASGPGKGKKVIVLGLDGMDPGLVARMIDAGQLPNFATLRRSGGFAPLQTSSPPQSPVAWANFINGDGPGSHGIFDFIHRDPTHQCAPFYAAAETLGAVGGWDIDDHRLQLEFWPFNHRAARTVLRRQGVPFWHYLDRAGIPSTFYNLPSNYPPSESDYGNHKCLAGMGTPDLQGNYGGYHHFAEDGPVRTLDEEGCKRSILFFEEHTAQAEIVGPPNTFLKTPTPVKVPFAVHRDIPAQAAAIDIQHQRLLIKQGQWSPWVRLTFDMPMPTLVPDEQLSGICRFYLQEVSPNFRLYVTPINTDPAHPALRISEPAGFIENIADELGMFYTTGFQEDYKALIKGVFTENEFIQQAQIVLDERLRLLDYALDQYDDGLLFFYFSSTDLQAHMLWWDGDEEHPIRSAQQAHEYFNHLKDIYRNMDAVLGRILKRYGDQATILVMSDHGFANFRRQFNLNSWLERNNYLTVQGDSLLTDADWDASRAYGLGINGLYVNLQGRERDGIVKQGQEYNDLLAELAAKLESVTDADGQPVVHKVHRTADICHGAAMALAPDLIIGYRRGFRASWATCLGGLTEQVLLDNDSAWSADHCADQALVPGVLFANRRIDAAHPALTDLAPTILAEFGLDVHTTMPGKNVFAGPT